MMKKLRCGKIYFAKVALERARKYCIKSRARKCANKRFRYSLSEPKPYKYCGTQQIVLTDFLSLCREGWLL